MYKHTNEDSANITPRMYAANRRSPAFCGRSLRLDRMPGWRKIGRGLIAAHDDSSDTPIVCAGRVYGVEIHNGVIGIASYRTEAQENKSYTINTAKLMAATRQYVRDRWPMTYDEMIADARAAYPTIWAPDPISWYAEYGLAYYEATGEIRNPLMLREEGVR